MMSKSDWLDRSDPSKGKGNNGILGSIKLLANIFLENTEVTEDGAILESAVPSISSPSLPEEAQNLLNLGRQRTQDMFTWIAHSCEEYRFTGDIEESYRYYSRFIEIFTDLPSQEVLRLCYRLGCLDIPKYVKVVGDKVVANQEKQIIAKWEVTSFNAMTYNVIAHTYSQVLEPIPFLQSLYSLRFPGLEDLDSYLFDPKNRTPLFSPSVKAMLGMDSSSD